MARDYVNFTKENKIALVTISKPPVNALNMQVLQELSEAFFELGNHKDLGAVVLTGAGNTFVAGADVKMISEMTPYDAIELCNYAIGVFGAIADFKTPVIAAISGMALGGGCELALTCDIRVADEGSIFGLPEVGLGVMPGAGGTQRLPRLIGTGKAKELIFSGDTIDVQEAKNIGLIERVAPKGESVSEAMKLASRIILRGPVSVAHAKMAINEGMGTDLLTGLRREAMLFSQLFKTSDKKEGIEAFMQKRKPEFKGE